MKTTLRVLLCLVASTDAFVPNRLLRVPTTTLLQAETAKDEETETTIKSKVKQLGLLTFDLDDTLYPIAPIVDDANGRFSIFSMLWPLSLEMTAALPPPCCRMSHVCMLLSLSPF